MRTVFLPHWIWLLLLLGGLGHWRVAWAQDTPVGMGSLLIIAFSPEETQQEQLDLTIRVSGFSPIQQLRFNGRALQFEGAGTVDELEVTIPVTLEPGENDFRFEAVSAQQTQQKEWSIFRETADVKRLEGPRQTWNWITLLERSVDSNAESVPDSEEATVGEQWRLTFVPRWTHRFSHRSQVSAQGLFTENRFDNRDLVGQESRLLRLGGEWQYGQAESGRWNTTFSWQETRADSQVSERTLIGSISWQTQPTSGWGGGLTWERQVLEGASDSGKQGREDTLTWDYAWIRDGFRLTGTLSGALKDYAEATNDLTEYGTSVKTTWTLGAWTPKLSYAATQSNYHEAEETPEQSLEHTLTTAVQWKAWPTLLFELSARLQQNDSNLSNVEYQKSVIGLTTTWIL